LKLLLASSNAKKRAELAALVAALGITVVAPADVGGIEDVDEDQDTFDGNARKKARAAALSTGLMSLADDSGLEVDALDGRPGVHSARYAGEPKSDANNNAKLLRELDGRTADERGARFRCALALADPSGAIVAECSGQTRGRILAAPRGASGFGYDPLFQFDEANEPGRGRTFAELTPAQKSSVSHRGRALARLVEHLRALVPPSSLSSSDTSDR